MGGLFSYCCGRSSTADTDTDALWAPLPNEQAPRRRGGRRASSPAPAFGEGALRDERWAQYTDPFQRTPGLWMSWCQCLAGPPWALTPGVPPAAALGPTRRCHAPHPLQHSRPLSKLPLAYAGRRGGSTELSSSPPPVSTSSAAPRGELGWESEPSWLREQALLIAQQAAAEEHRGERWGFLRGGHRSRSSSPEPRPAAAATVAGSRARQRQPAGAVQQAPAFGEGALTRWH